MRLLLDTHALLWWMVEPRRLGPAARAAIGDEDNAVLVSAVSAMEVATKFRLGKLPQGGRLALGFAEEVATEGFEELPITIAHAARAGSLPFPHRDPFDRLLIAQAQIESLSLVSNEALFDRFGVTRIW